jgi:hypothetical protein
MNLGPYLGLLHDCLTQLHRALAEVATAHGDEPDVRLDCDKFAKRIERHADLLRPVLEQYRPSDAGATERSHLQRMLLTGTRDGPLGLLLDLHDLYLLTCECDISWTLVERAAQGARDPGLVQIAEQCASETELQMAWLRSRIKQSAPQALLVAD